MHFSVSSFSFLGRAVLGEGPLFPAVGRVISCVFSRMPKGMGCVGGWAFSEPRDCSTETLASLALKLYLCCDSF